MSKKIGCVGHDCEKCQSEKVKQVNWNLVYLHVAMEYIRQNYTQVYSECGDCEEFRANRIKEIEQSAQHPDDAAVDRFATAMKAKMAKQRAKGYGGWNDKAACSTERLQAMLEEHLSKGDPVDVGNFAMMLWSRGEQTAVTQKAQQEPWGWAIMHSDGTYDWIRPRIADFFGSIQEREPYTSEDVKHADREWAGLAPHTVVTLYTHPQASEPEQPVQESDDLTIAYMAGLHDGRKSAQPAQQEPGEMSDAEFLSKRLGRVAKLVGVPIPDRSHEHIAGVAGTILGDIARKLEAQQEPAAVVIGCRIPDECNDQISVKLPPGTKLYTRPQAREPLTHGEKSRVWGRLFGPNSTVHTRPYNSYVSRDSFDVVVAAIEAAHDIGEKK